MEDGFVLQPANNFHAKPLNESVIPFSTNFSTFLCLSLSKIYQSYNQYY